MFCPSLDDIRARLNSVKSHPFLLLSLAVGMNVDERCAVALANAKVDVQLNETLLREMEAFTYRL